MADTREVMSEQQRVVEEQAALRRVATLVAGGAGQDEIFAAVAAEVGRLLDVPIVQMSRYVSDTTVMVVGVSGEQPPFTQGSQWPLDGPTLSARVRDTGRPARIDDYADLPGTIPDLVRQAGVRSGVGAPIVVNGKLWGVIMGLATDEATLPAGIEDRLLGFTELVGTAIANADARANLRSLAEEQAALSKIAVTVAEGAPPEEVFAGVAAEIGRLLDVPAISMVRFEPDGTSTAIALWGEGNPFGVGATFEPWPGVMQQVRETGRPARLEDFAYSTGPTTARLQEARIHSGVGVPIIVDGRVWGTTIALATGGATLPDGVEERLSRFTRLVATAIGNTQARDELRGLADEQAALRRVATLVAEGARPDDVLAAVASEIARVLNVPLVGTYRYESDRTATIVASWGENDRHQVGSGWPLEGRSVVAEVFHTGQPARIDDYSGVHSDIADVARETGIRSCVGVPIIIDGGLWGVVTAATTMPEPLGDQVVTRLRAFTELVGTAIADTEAQDDLRLLAEEQGALRHVATLIAKGAEPNAVLGAIAEQIAHVLGVTNVGIYRYEPDEGATIVAAWGGHPQPIGHRHSIRGLQGHSVLAAILETGQAARIDDYSNLQGEMAEVARELGLLWTAGVPIEIDGRLWGVMAAASQEPDPTPERTEARLSAFTELAATAISNSQIGDDLRRLADEQGALRRVATLVAEGAAPRDVFSSVAEEIGKVLRVPLVSTYRYEADGTALVVANWGDPLYPVGSRLNLEGLAILPSIRETGRPAKVDDYFALGGEVAQAAREAGFRWAVGVPIVIDGRVWGAMTAASPEPNQNPARTQERLVAFTELVATAISNTQVSDDVHRLADEQAALRRVATLVAEGAPAEEVFAAVAQETAQVSGLPLVELARFDSDGFATVMASAGDHPLKTGTRWPMDNPIGSIAIQETRAPARIEYTDAVPGTTAAALRSIGVRWACGVPIVVDGRVWGSLGAADVGEEPLPPGTEDRLIGFTELVATAVSNATTQAQLLASRARIVTAGDDARRRIERNLHDGTQQQLVSLGLDLQALKNEIPADLGATRAEIGRLQEKLVFITDEIREISRGLHPSLLSHAGLAAALRSLARTSAVPVELEVELDHRLPQSIEIATYFVVSESLANAAKHAQASHVRVGVVVDDGCLRAVVADDGKGGARPEEGSGLTGLIDRVEALGGRLALSSPYGKGTTVEIELPLYAAVPAA